MVQTSCWKDECSWNLPNRWPNQGLLKKFECSSDVVTRIKVKTAKVVQTQTRPYGRVTITTLMSSRTCKWRSQPSTMFADISSINMNVKNDRMGKLMNKLWMNILCAVAKQTNKNYDYRDYDLMVLLDKKSGDQQSHLDSSHGNDEFHSDPSKIFLRYFSLERTSNKNSTNLWESLLQSVKAETSFFSKLPVLPTRDIFSLWYLKA